MARERRSARRERPAPQGDAPSDQPPTLGDRFGRWSRQITEALGSFPALVGSVLVVLVWALTGPLFNFSDTWQLVINTTTTVATFWMVFVIQNTTNRESKTTRLKLDELIRAVHDARNEFLVVDHAPEADLDRHELEFALLATETVTGGQPGGDDGGRAPAAKAASGARPDKGRTRGRGSTGTTGGGATAARGNGRSRSGTGERGQR